MKTGLSERHALRWSWSEIFPSIRGSAIPLSVVRQKFTIARFFLEIRCNFELSQSPRGYARCLCGWTPCETLWQENIQFLFSPSALRATIDRHHLSMRRRLRSLNLVHPSLAGLSRRQGNGDVELPHVRIERRSEESFFPRLSLSAAWSCPQEWCGAGSSGQSVRD